MHLRYLNDRKSLEFRCIKDIASVEQVDDFGQKPKEILTTYIVKKGEKILIVISSKEIVVAILILVHSTFTYEKSIKNDLTFSTSQISNYRLIKSNNSKGEEMLSSLRIPSFIEDQLFKLRGGNDEIEFKEKDEVLLIESIMAKSGQTEVEEKSLNKIIKSILKVIEPVIFNQKLWAIIKQSQISVESKIDASSVPSNKILGSNKAESESSSIFVNGFVTPIGRRKTPSNLPLENDRLSTARNKPQTRLEGRRNPSEYQLHGYSEEQIQMFEKNPRYSELAKDPQLMGQEVQINPKLNEEACTILQAENEGLISGARRSDLKAGDPNYDYRTDTPSKFTEIKVPRDDSPKDEARLGRKAGLQRRNDGDVTLVVNLIRLRPEKRVAYAKTFLEAAGGEGVIFINN